MAVFKRLSTPQKIQDFLNTLPINYEKHGETLYSPRMVLREKKAHCMEGALLAAAAFWIHGQEPLLMDFKTLAIDEYHVVAPFKQNGYWGAISKTNHPILRYRDPVYRTLRELALSYFHEYFMFEKGTKTLRSYTRPLNLKQYGHAWITTTEDLWWLDTKIDSKKHFPVVPAKNIKLLRTADRLEIEAADRVEWKKSDKRT